MFTDMVGYSGLSQRNEALALELLGEHHAILRKFFPQFNGVEIKTTGDGFLIEFASALSAVRCAVEIQRALAERNKTQPAERAVNIRIGIHVGDVVHGGGDVHGDGVNIAARIEPLAEPGGICISNSIHDQIENKIGHPLVRLSRPKLKNIQQHVEVYKVVLDGIVTRTLPSRPDRARYAVALAIVALLAAGIVLLVKSGRRSRSDSQATNASTALSPDSAAPDQTSVAVLPFVNMSGEATDEYLSDGMTEELLNSLARVPGLRVPGRTSSFAFKGRNDQGIFQEVGKQLHVRSVLEGSVRKAGEKLRVTTQLINVADGFHLWSENYDGDMKDILAFQSEVAQRVAKSLQVKLGMEAVQELAKKPTENPEAHRLYLLGRFQFVKFTENGWREATRYFSEAIQLDTNYALAYCGLADTYGWAGISMMPGKTAWAKERELAQRALNLDPNLADAHLSLGIAFGNVFEFNPAEKEYQRALELNSNLALAHDQYAWLAVMTGRFDEGIAKQQKALGLDPLSPLINTDMGWMLEVARRYDSAIAHLQNFQQLYPNNAWSHYLLGWCYFWKGQTAQAVAEFEKAKSLDARPMTSAALGYLAAVSGDRAEANRVLAELTQRARDRHVTPWAFGLIHLGLGEKDKTLDALDQCYEEQDAACWMLKVDPIYDSVRNEPRFQALLKKLGLD